MPVIPLTFDLTNLLQLIVHNNNSLARDCKLISVSQNRTIFSEIFYGLVSVLVHFTLRECCFGVMATSNCNSITLILI